jgi:head-tail adaptor
MSSYQHMNQCVHLLQSRRKYDEYGDVSESWVDMGRVWAKIIPKASTNGRPTYEVTIRHPNCHVDRIEWEGKAYIIVGRMEEDARRTWRRFLVSPIFSSNF